MANVKALDTSVAWTRRDEGKEFEVVITFRPGPKRPRKDEQIIEPRKFVTATLLRAAGAMLSTRAKQLDGSRGTCRPPSPTNRSI